MTDTIGPIMQLLLKGPQDAYLDGTDFSYMYSPLSAFKRHSRFALDTCQEHFPRGFVLGQRVTMEIPLKGDLLGPAMLELRLPRIPQAAVEDVWAPSIGYALIRHVRIWLNETLLVDQERLWLDIRDKLFESPSRRKVLADMCGGTARSLTEEHVIFVPLSLPWDTPSNYFPLVALPGVHIVLDMDVEAYDKCIIPSETARQDATSGRIKNAVYASSPLGTVIVTLFPSASPSTLDILPADGGDAIATTAVEAGATTAALVVSLPFPDGGLVASCDGDTRRIVAASPAFPGPTPELRGHALFDMVYLDRDEAYTLIRSRMVYMYDTTLDMEAKTYRDVLGTDGSMTTTYLPSVKVDLSEINFPTRALIWVVYRESDAVTPAAYFTYVRDALTACQISCNAQDLTLQRPSARFELVSTYANGPRVVSESSGIALHAFALDINSSQPSGSLAMEKTRQPFLNVWLDEDILGNTPAIVKVFAIVRRVLVLYKGRAQFVTN